MERTKCKACGKEVTGMESHYCESSGKDESHDGDFALSMIVGMVTDNAIIGGLVGGSMLGGIVGDLLDGDGQIF